VRGFFFFFPILSSALFSCQGPYRSRYVDEKSVNYSSQATAIAQVYPSHKLLRNAFIEQGPRAIEQVPPFHHEVYSLRYSSKSGLEILDLSCQSSFIRFTRRLAERLSSEKGFKLKFVAVKWS